ncbi:MAG: FeS-binding protein [Acidobacteriota bacterium]
MNSLWIYRAAMAVLAVSGVAQMPVFKRYGIASIPGLGWTADYFFTHRLHYGAAALLLFWLARRLLLGGPAALGRARLALLGALVLTGAIRVLKNLPEVDFSPLTVMLVDWTHLAAAMAIGLAALAVLAKRRAGARAPINRL